MKTRLLTAAIVFIVVAAFLIAYAWHMANVDTKIGVWKWAFPRVAGDFIALSVDHKNPSLSELSDHIEAVNKSGYSYEIECVRIDEPFVHYEAVDPWGKSLYFEFNDIGEITLVGSCGPDGKRDTWDDIRYPPK